MAIGCVDGGGGFCAGRVGAESDSESEESPSTPAGGDAAKLPSLHSPFWAPEADTVIATATDEPDYGMDIGLWADNGTDGWTLYSDPPAPVLFKTPMAPVSGFTACNHMPNPSLLVTVMFSPV